jgi:hypothetical protein
VDIRWPEGVGGRLELDGRGRDLATDGAGIPVVLAAAATQVVIEAGEVVALQVEPPVDVAALLGTPAQRTRRVISSHLPTLAADGSLLGLLLDEIPVTALISGHARLRTSRIFEPTGEPPAPGGQPVPVPVSFGPSVPIGDGGRPVRGGPKLDICIGWASGGFMAGNAEQHLHPQSYEAVVVPPLLDPADPVGWHAMPSVLPPSSLRRNRRLDLWRDEEGDIRIEGLFRDQYYEDDGRVTGVHEYTLGAVVEPHERRLVSIEASPRVLPGPDCPGAAASAQRLVGRTLDELRSLVRSAFNGATTCTHLNDQLRALGDLHALVDHLP